MFSFLGIAQLNTYQLRLYYDAQPGQSILFSSKSVGTGFTIKVTDPKNQPVSYAMVYVRSGSDSTLFVADKDGVIDTVLNPGKYTLDFSFPGLKSCISNVLIDDQGVAITQVLVRDHSTELYEITSANKLKEIQLSELDKCLKNKALSFCEKKFNCSISLR